MFLVHRNCTFIYFCSILKLTVPREGAKNENISHAMPYIHDKENEPRKVRLIIAFKTQPSYQKSMSSVGLVFHHFCFSSTVWMGYKLRLSLVNGIIVVIFHEKNRIASHYSLIQMYKLLVINWQILMGEVGLV